ncbi:secretin and TonB N-terminal domain-containing protein [Megasphaera vaginalis (ex Bordigoni et al. 2020)]|uniref:secretin and TonB N-terminal domain-containing protein n=1 Tax=Megasphaera vaginalis (ex Bordigoni et al. 2020) TaxID=2045301 RepID=UPI001F391BD3|nr:secretin and TonB N-terminal domain-containing protein [Megasphaera vaginalis (ex Bordigoni et al. 2020)]
MNCIDKRTARRWLGPVLFWCVFCGNPIAAAPLSVDVSDAPIRTVLEGLAKSGGINLVVDDTVQGSMTLHLENVTAEEAIKAIVAGQNLYYNRGGAIASITAGREQRGVKRLYTWALQHAEPAEVAEAVRAAIPAEQVRTYAGTNRIVIGGTPAEAAAVGRLVEVLDREAAQADVEVEVVSLTQDAMKELGLDWSWGGVPGGPGRSGLFSFEGKVRALLTEGKAKLLARPHLLAANGKEAKILIGDRIPVLTEHEKGQESVTTTEYRDAGIQLVYTPRIHDDGSVTAKIDAEVSTPVLVPQLKAYRIATRQVTTEVRMEPGKTLVIGGLINREDVENFRKIPLLGDLPVLGRLFRSHYRSQKETEIVILIRLRSKEETKVPEEYDTLRQRRVNVVQ